jgi:hypothetical protein
MISDLRIIAFLILTPHPSTYVTNPYLSFLMLTGTHFGAGHTQSAASTVTVRSVKQPPAAYNRIRYVPAVGKLLKVMALAVTLVALS